MQPAIHLALRILDLGAGGAGPNPQPALPTIPATSTLPRAAATSPSAAFNKREIQLLGLLSEGLSNAQLAKQCCISEGTVKWYLHNLYEKLGVGNRTALLRAVRELGLRL